MRSRLVSERTAVANQIRAFLLERGIAMRQRLRSLWQALLDILAKRTDVLTPRMTHMIEWLMQDWAKELEPKARFVKINVDNEPELAGRLGVQGIPALFVLKNGAVVARQAGLANQSTLQNRVRQFSPP